MRKHNHRNNQVLNIIEDGIKNKNIKYKRNTNVINITFNTLNASTVVELFDKYGINISGGSACMSGSEKPADSFLKSGYTYDEAMRTIRISVGFTNKRRHAKKFLKIFNYIIDNYDC